MQIRWQSWVAGSMQHQRRVLAALVLPLCGCGGIDAVELQVDDMAVSRAALPEDEADDVMWPNDSPFLPQDCEDLATKVDSGVPTDCPRNKFVIGIAMGKGHNSDYNLPHTIRCCDLYSQRYGLIQKSEGDRTIRETLVDYDDMIYCSAGMTEYGMLAGQMMSGLTGGWGHSSNHNMPHQFTCHGLGFVSGWWVNATDSILITPPVDSDRIVECPRGGGIIGISGGWGHSSKHNVPHMIACSTGMFLYRD